MLLHQSLSEYISACFTGLWVQSHEQEDAIAEIVGMCRQEHWNVATWDIERGLQIPGDQHASDAGGADPLAAIRSVNALATADGSAILVLQNFHRFLNSPEIVQALVQQIAAGKQNRTFILVLAPLVQIPPELEKLFVVIEHALPDRQQLEEIARGVATEEGEIPEADSFQCVLDAAAGLTRYEAEGAFSLSLVRHRMLRPETIWELKSGMLKKSGLLQLHRGGERFADLGGLDALKAFCLRALRPRDRTGGLVRAKGILLLGVPGTGKSALAKALGNETGRPTLTMDVGTLMGSLVGQSEANVRQALRIADAMAPSILFVDEVEKALAGAAGSGQSDSGVSARLFGNLLTWLNDHETDVFVVATCNDITRLPPEFGRSERFDGIFFLDLPGVQQRRAIWNLYVARFGLDPRQTRPVDADWTGAEIRSCCRLAALLDVPLVEAAQNVVPVARTACEAVARLRAWASRRCLNAETPGGLYRHDCAESSSGKPGRRVRRDPSNN